eukprot:COSAG01_NODE_897_length_12874_cov_17.636115_6_plen_108_part_00
MAWSTTAGADRCRLSLRASTALSHSDPTSQLAGRNPSLIQATGPCTKHTAKYSSHVVRHQPPNRRSVTTAALEMHRHPPMRRHAIHPGRLPPLAARLSPPRWAAAPR